MVATVTAVGCSPLGQAKAEPDRHTNNTANRIFNLNYSGEIVDMLH